MGKATFDYLWEGHNFPPILNLRIASIRSERTKCRITVVVTVIFLTHPLTNCPFNSWVLPKFQILYVCQYGEGSRNDELPCMVVKVLLKLARGWTSSFGIGQFSHHGAPWFWESFAYSPWALYSPPVKWGCQFPHRRLTWRNRCVTAHKESRVGFVIKHTHTHN